MFIAATGFCLPGIESTATAVAEGRYDPDECRQNGLEAVGVSHELSAAEMGVEAARVAFSRSPVDPRDLAVVLHASFYHQGHDHWTPASYIQRESIGGRAPAIEVKQASNGSLAALVLAMSFLSVHEGATTALITTADRFCLPGYDRYRSDKWIIGGDNATAAVISCREGFARVLSTAMDADPTLEELYRDSSFTDVPFAGGMPIQLRPRKESYMARVGLRHIVSSAKQGLRNVMDVALRDARIGIDDVACFVLPNIGHTLLHWEYLAVLDIPESRTTWAWGRRIGHGAGDQIGGLNHLMESGALRVGDRVVLATAGIGFSWSCAVVEILETPRWEASPVELVH
ncbi:ketoacyl-ACP synthase III family protein [Micromonospora sp. KC606]|uniref:ketoacyl-ACP synthase III family protein n=1 Tax=Micromonospora sp. KC606 TaxID=2530379 RepID=UPI0014048FF6|nr:ketoacyl-ACP synthase III family protein [Micromonospora sp. KC606]